MKKKFIDNFYDSLKSVLPITIIVFSLGLIIGIPNKTCFAFIISSFMLIFGITLFTTGADISIVLIGESIGNFLVKKRNKILIIFASLLMGIVITISEPDLIVLSSQVPSIPSYLMIMLVALGIGIFLSLGVYRIIKKVSYRKMVSLSLLVIMILLYFTKEEFVSLSFDAAGVTTGPMSVPVIVAFGYGIAKFRNDKDAKSDTFGLCGLASFGPVIVLLILSLFFKLDNYYSTSSFVSYLSLQDKFIKSFITSFKDILVSLTPIVGFFIISIILGNKVSKNKIFKIIIGLLFTIIGLTLFLSGVSFGFIEMGYLLGNSISSYNIYLLIPLGVILGYIIINAEPAIKVLTKQVFDLTEGSISEKMISLSLSIGVALAVGLSACRVIFNIPMIYIIVPGYFLAVMLSYHTPNMFVTIAYDSGGAACGALTTSFLLPLCIGACINTGGNILSIAFGVGSLVCLTPIIMIQILGIIYNNKLKIKNKKVFDETIIDFVWEGH